MSVELLYILLFIASRVHFFIPFLGQYTIEFLKSQKVDDKFRCGDYLPFMEKLSRKYRFTILADFYSLF